MLTINVSYHTSLRGLENLAYAPDGFINRHIKAEFEGYWEITIRPLWVVDSTGSIHNSELLRNSTKWTAELNQSLSHYCSAESANSACCRM